MGQTGRVGSTRYFNRVVLGLKSLTLLTKWVVSGLTLKGLAGQTGHVNPFDSPNILHQYDALDAWIRKPRFEVIIAHEKDGSCVKHMTR